MHIHVLSVPYDSGHARTRMGRGPDALLDGGLPEQLRAAGHSVEIAAVETHGSFLTEIAAAFDLNRQLSTQVQTVTSNGAFPLVLTGNCVSCLGIVAGLRIHDLGVLWFDAHGDFQTPETSTSGFLDGMALATATGQCWSTLARTIPDFRAVPANRVGLFGAHAFDPGERERFESAGGTVFDAPTLRSGSGDERLSRLRQRASQLYVHLDLDVLDPAEGQANVYAVPGGLRRAEILEQFARVRQLFTVAGACVSAYDPAYDSDSRVLNAAIEFVRELLEPAGI
ncbi:MAG: arginase family protein [Acidobacteria bacterium]|nr:arginase family protein [Acidobacteriota bacterium]MCA1649197.1 arginase family protein [Acidobacteriota bacterium]